MELIPSNKIRYPNIFFPRFTFLPNQIRIFFGKLEMLLRTSDNIKDRIKLIDLAFIDKLLDITISPKKNLSEQIIWQYWNLGITNAPKIVKQCIKSVELNKGNLKHIVLSDRNVFEYISLPEHIIKKWDLINPTKKSNLIRLALLSTYGGVWIDATCFLTKGIPKNYLNAEIFMFINTSKDRLIRNWFICCSKNNIIINSLLKIHYMFYLKYTEPTCYFFFHYMFENLITMNKKIRYSWINSNPKVIFQETIDILLLSIKSQNSLEKTNAIFQDWINKLSWKLNPDLLQELSLILDNSLTQIKNRNSGELLV